MRIKTGVSINKGVLVTPQVLLDALNLAASNFPHWTAEAEMAGNEFAYQPHPDTIQARKELAEMYRRWRREGHGALARTVWRKNANFKAKLKAMIFTEPSPPQIGGLQAFLTDID